MGGIYGEKACPAGTLNASSNHIWSSILSTGIPGNEAIALHWSRWLTEPDCRWGRKSKGCGVRRQISYFWLHLLIQSFTQIKLVALTAARDSYSLLSASWCQFLFAFASRYIKCHLSPLKKLIVFALVLCRLLLAVRLASLDTGFY